MSLAYHAAEYFVEAIGQSPSLSISCDYVTYLYSSALNEVQTYLNKNAKGDLYFIFKKFPDVFVIKKGLVSLTDAFLFIYALKRSTAPKVVKSSRGINDYYENAAVAFCNTIVSRYGSQHYLTLFRMLVNDSNQIIASHFRHYSSSDAYFFFLSHADAFIVNKCYVSLNTQSLLNVPEQNSVDSEDSKELIDSVYFLLTCFESLHYIELRQCASYVLKSAKDLLDKYSLIKQRKMFENMPKIKMDCFGFLSLSDMNVNLSISNDQKLLLLLVCILAFEREMHFERIVRDVASGRSSVVSSLSSLPVDEQLQYFKKFPNYFCVSDKGNVSLLPSFICPICSFEGLSEYKNKQSNKSTVKSEISYPSSELNNKLEKDSNGINKQPVTSDRDILNSKSNETQEKLNVCVKKICAEMFSVKDISENSKRRLVVSIVFLLETFLQLDHKRALKTLLHVFCDIKMSFCSLSETDKHHFVKAFCEILNSKSIKRIELNSTSMGEIAKEKILLFITYLLTNTLEMHFEKIAAEIRNKKITQLSSSISNQFKFFKTFPVLIKIKSDGYVSLTQSFDLVSSAVESYSDMLSQHSHKGNTIKEKGQESVSKGEKTIDSKKMAQLPSGLMNSVSPKKNEVLSKALGKAKIKTQDMFKMLDSAFFWIRMHFKNVLDSHIIEAYILALNDVYNYFHNLAFENRFNFVEECYNVIKSCNENPPSDNSHCISAYQDGVLFCTYLIVKEKRMHFQKIVTSLKSFNLNTPVCEKTASEQFKYFKQFGRYFEIDNDGFVTLKSSFNSVSSIVNSVISFKSRTSVKCKQDNKQDQTFSSPLQKTVRQASMSPQGSLMVKVNKNCIKSKNSPEKKAVSSNIKESADNVLQSRSESTMSSDVSVISDGRELTSNSNNSSRKIQKSSFDKPVLTNLLLKALGGNNTAEVSQDIKFNFSKPSLQHMQINKISAESNESNIFTNMDTSKTSESFQRCCSQETSKFQNKNACLSNPDNLKLSPNKEANISIGKCSELLVPKDYVHKDKITAEEVVNIESILTNLLQKVLGGNNTAAATQDIKFNFTKPSLQHLQINKNSAESNESNISANRDTPKMSEPFPRCNTIHMDFDKFSSSEDKLSIKHIRCNYDTTNQQAAGDCSELTKSGKVLSNDVSNGSISSTERKISSQAASNLSVVNSNNYSDVSLCDNSHAAYISELIDSLQHLQINKSSAESNESNIFTNRDTSKMSEPFPKSNTIHTDFDKFLSSEENKLSIKHISDNYDTINRQTTEGCSELTKSDKVLSNDILNRSISSTERKISSQTASNLSVANSSNYSDVLFDNSYASYISELIDSYLDNSKNQSFADNIPKSQNASYQNAQTTDDAPCSHNRSKIHNNTDNSQAQNVRNPAENISVPSTSKCNSVPKNSSLSTSVSSFSLSEIRAINFFCVILQNYKNYESGVSTAFLQEQLNLASSEVQSFMRSHFQDDMLSFFLKHRSVFYVSPVSHKICLVKD